MTIRYLFFPAAGGGVTVALTGVGATGALGTLSPQASSTARREMSDDTLQQKQLGA